VWNAGMRTGKGTPYNGGTRAIGFFRWPGTLPPAEVDRLTAHIDLFPTFAELAGTKIPDGARLDGYSLVPLLEDPNAPWPDRYLFTHVGRWAKGQASNSKYQKCSVRHGPYIMVNPGGKGQPKWELYDLKSDPGEKSDIAAERPDILKDLEAAYDKWWDEVLPCLENENAVGPAVNPFKELYWKQYAGPGPNNVPPGTSPATRNKKAPKADKRQGAPKG
ncbi:MAG: sulfatase-like hydrolase/transferase, partial [Candidatus Sumerlaeota bacterium]|nr:sulfatase-like hydrolase/transferase [Candidatus Sumerlaeota bacterium]